MKRVVDVSDAEAGQQLAALRDIAERFRNLHNHGALGHDGRSAMFVHLPGAGEVPVLLGEFGVRQELLFVPAVKDDFDQICAVFDSCDNWLTNGPLADGHRWAAAGLDFRFDAEFLASVAAVRSQGRFEEFLEAAALHDDAVMNWEI